MWGEFTSFFSELFVESILEFGYAIWTNLPDEIQRELAGFAAASSMPKEIVAVLNMAYELTDGCTSIVSTTTTGQILHARNLDFGQGFEDTEHLRDMAVILDYTSGGKVIFSGIGIVGFAGVMTGLKNDAFGLSINTRFMPEGYYGLITNALDFLVKGYTTPTLLARTTFLTETNYSGAVAALSTVKLVAPVFYTVSGLGGYDGAIITRDREQTHDVRALSQQNWYQLVTNYDWWTNPPWYDNRREQAIDSMVLMGQKRLAENGLVAVLSTRPVQNMETIYTSVVSAKSHLFDTWVRECDDDDQPCPF
jgi:hypothetical protein